VARYSPDESLDYMDYILKDVGIGLWNKVKANLERNSMSEVIFEGLKWYRGPAETARCDKMRKL